MDKKIILITGSRKGIGRYLVEYYSGKEYKVLGFSRQESDYKSENYSHFCIDIGDDKLVKHIFSEIRKKYGRIDIIINNAAINPSISPFILIPADTIKRVYTTNVFGLMNSCREGIKLMIKNNYGRIVNLSSMAVKHEIYGETIYTSTKAAITSFTRVLAKEVIKNGITCNVIAPSAIPTDLSLTVDQNALNEVLKRNAINHLGRMEDVSNTIDWLIKDESNAITGQVIYLGGV
ncbi:MAG: SDR family NAD(P)-dependent oxidoreductase [Bacteroidetes bacterium]|nr:SDR family NAD(P)-dependent oxidoreductase [Bacteroidota bacterium]